MGVEPGVGIQAPKHVPPSRRHFELNHPTVTTRVARDLHLALMDLAEVVRDALSACVESTSSAEPPDEEQPEVLATTDPGPVIATFTHKAPADPYLDY